MGSIKFRSALSISKCCFISVIALSTILPTVAILYTSSAYAVTPTWSTELDSIANDGSLPNNSSGGNSIVSTDGRYVYFQSVATNLVPNDTNSTYNIYVRDRKSGTTTILDVNNSGQVANNGVVPGFDISDDGRYLVFSSSSTNLVSTPIYNNAANIYLRDLQTGTTTLLFSNSFNGQSSNGPEISGDGNWIVFNTQQPLAPYSDTSQNLYLINRTTLAVTRITNGIGGAPVNGNLSGPAAINYDGSEIAFGDGASNLVSNDTNNQADVFLWSSSTNTVSRISVSSTGTQANNYSEWPQISDKGDKIVYQSYATNLTPNGIASNQVGSYLYQVNTGTTSLVDVTPSGQQGNGNSQDPYISGDGNSIVFASTATDLVPNNTSSHIQVYVRDLLASTTSLASPGFTTYGAGGQPSISTNGQYVTFAANSPTSGMEGIYLASMTTAPSAPTNLTLTTPNPTNQAPGLSWDTVSGATIYNVYRNGNTTPIATVPAPSSGTTVTYTDTSAPQGTDSYYVTAVNTGGESPASNTVSDLYDTTPPTITYSLSPAANSNGWNNSATTVTFNCSDPTTGVTITACSSPTTVSNDGANQQVTGTATDSAGNTTSLIATVNVDSTAPTITSSLNVAPNAAGWNNTPVTVSYTCNDATSGIASCSAPQTELTDGSYTLSGTATDNAGNSSSINTTVNIDQTPPSVSSVTLGSNPLAMDAATTLTASVSDNLSGVNKVEYYVGTDPGAGNGSSMTYDSSTGTASASFGPFTTPGTYTVYVRSQDVAGNWSSPQALTFTVYPAAANLSLAPSSQTGTVGGSVSFTATATDTSNNPVAGITVHYDVSGSVTTSGSCVTDSTGTCTFSYTGPQLPGADLVDAYADNNNNGAQDQNEPTTNASVSWDLPPNSTTSGSVHGHGRFIASNGDHMNVAFHAVNQNGTVTGACNIVDQTTNVVYSCTDATVLVENTTTGQATIFGDITINGTATTYRMDVADNSATNQPDTFNFVTQSGYNVGGTMDSNAKVVVQ